MRPNNLLRLVSAATLMIAALGCSNMTQNSGNASTKTNPAPYVQAKAAPLPPPIAKRTDYAVPSAFGARNDPYYWLRDDTRKNPQMLAYLAAENAYRERQKNAHSRPSNCRF